MGLVYEPGCVDFIRALAPKPKKAMRAALDRLDEDPMDDGLDWRRLATRDERQLLYRLRIGDYRVAYILEGPTVRVVKVFHRREGYGWMERLGY